MVQTAPAPPVSGGNDTTEAKTRAPRTEADYGIEEMEFLPAKPGRTSKVSELLDTVKTDHPGKWMVVAKYEKPGAAAAQASTLRAKHGPVEANGWEFATRQIEGGKRTALFAQFNVQNIKAGAAETYERIKAEKEAKRLEKKAEKDRKAAKAEDKASRQAAK